MKIFRYIGVILLTVIMMSCGSSGGGGAGSGDSSVNSGTSTLTVAIGDVSAISGAVTYTDKIPPLVLSVKIMVMIQGSFQTRIVNVNGRTGILEKFTGPNGTWDVQVNAYAEENAQGQPTYLGHTIQGVSGDTTIYVQMEPIVPKFRVFVSNVESGNVSAIDQVTYDIKTLNCAPGTTCNNPMNLAANHDTSLSVYVPFSISDNVFDVDADNPLLDMTNEIKDQELIEPYAVAFNCDGSEAWVVNWGYEGETIIIIDTQSHSVKETLYDYDLGSQLHCLDHPVGIAIANGKAYIANTGTDNVCVVDVATRTEATIIPTAGTPRYTVATPNGSFVYVSTDSLIEKIDTSDDAIKHHFVGGAYNMGASPDSSRVYAATGSNGVFVIDVNTDTFGSVTVNGSQSLYAVTVTSDGSRIFATDGVLNKIFVFGPGAVVGGSVNPVAIPNSSGAEYPQAITSAPGVRTEMCQTQNLCIPTLLIPVEGDTLDNACTNPPIPYTWQFSWDDNCEPDATQYDIEVTQVIGGVRTPLHATSTPDVFYPFSSLTVHSTSTPVEWRVRAVFDTLEGAWSAFRGFFLRTEAESCPQ